jgi:hypothetical protein
MPQSLRNEMMRELEHHRTQIDALAAKISLARAGTPQARTLIQNTSARVVRHRIRVALLESRLAVGVA